MNRITTNPLGIPGEETEEVDCGCGNLKPGDRVALVGEFCDATRTIYILPEATMLEPKPIDHTKGGWTKEEFDAIVRERIKEFYLDKMGIAPSTEFVETLFVATVNRMLVKQFQFDDGTIIEETEIGSFGSVECGGEQLKKMESLPLDHKLHGSKVVRITDVKAWLEIKRGPIVGYAGGIDEHGKVFKGRPIHANEDMTKVCSKLPKFVVCSDKAPERADPDMVVEHSCSKCGGKCYRNKKEHVAFKGIPTVCKTCFEAMDLKAMAEEEAAENDGSTSFTA